MSVPFLRALVRRFSEKRTRRPSTATKKKKSRSAPLRRKPLSFLPRSKPSKQKLQSQTLPLALTASPPMQSARGHDFELTTKEFVRPGDRLRSALEGFLLDQRSEHTRRAYAKDLKRFVKFLLVRIERQGAEPLGRNIIIAYKDWLLSERLQHTTVDRHLATLRGAFGWLQEEGILTRNPAEHVRFMNPKKLSKTQGFTDDQVRLVLEQPNIHSRVGAAHYAVLMVLFFCGLRRSELCGLRTSQISIERGHPVLRLTGKGNSERLVPLVPSVWRAIRYYCKISRKDMAVDQPLFPMDPSNVFYIVRRYARLAGIMSRVSPHSCRATAISNARDHNASDRAIQEFAGWASPDMITRYDKRKTSIENSAAHAISYGEINRGDLPKDPAEPA